MKKRTYICIVCLIVILAVAVVCMVRRPRNQNSDATILLGAVPPFSGNPYVVINENKPGFLQSDMTDRSFEFYSELDSLNRCGYAMACVGRDAIPTEERGSIGQVKPTGWQTVKYEIVDGKYLYNRCHLIGYQLTGENANERNLITGTRYLNVEGMLPFENMIADYIKETGNHVMYRVTPMFCGDELVARGVQMEALSVEDNGYGICFNVYAYNNQPGVEINYATGESMLSVDDRDDDTSTGETVVTGYVLNTNSKRFHLSSCGQGQSTKEENRACYNGNRDELISDGYSPAGCCDP